MRRRLRSGYTDFGGIQIPPHPQQVVLTDRTTGVQWALSFETSPVERISITTDLASIKRLEGATVYGPDEGPAFDQDGQYVLFLDNGRLGVRFTQFPIYEEAYDNMPIYARQARAERLVNLDTLDLLTFHLGYIAP